MRTNQVRNALGQVLAQHLLAPPAPHRGRRGQGFGDTPASSTLKTVATATLLFYAAERRVNPKVTSMMDALLYVTTCLSVGYADIHPMTPTGKLIGSALMVVGPSLAATALSGPRDAKDDATQAEILATLKEILARMPERV